MIPEAVALDTDLNLILVCYKSDIWKEEVPQQVQSYFCQDRSGGAIRSAPPPNQLSPPIFVLEATTRPHMRLLQTRLGVFFDASCSLPQAFPQAKMQHCPTTAFMIHTGTFARHFPCVNEMRRPQPTAFPDIMPSICRLFGRLCHTGSTSTLGKTNTPRQDFLRSTLCANAFQEAQPCTVFDSMLSIALI
jgi:hypothetical protein